MCFYKSPYAYIYNNFCQYYLILKTIIAFICIENVRVTSEDGVSDILEDVDDEGFEEFKRM